MTDMAIVHLPTETRKSVRAAWARVVAEWLVRTREQEPATKTETRAAWEITEVTRVERYDTAPWLFF